MLLSHLAPLTLSTPPSSLLSPPSSHQHHDAPLLTSTLTQGIRTYSVVASHHITPHHLSYCLQMYAPNEYYRPYNPNKGRDRYRERQRLPAHYVSTEGKDKTPTFRMLSSPASPGPGPVPASLNTYSSLDTVEDLLPGADRTDRTECHCRISSLVKAFVFLGILLGATVGLVIFFLAGSGPNTETLQTERDHFSQERNYSESSENFLGAQGELINNRNTTPTTQSPHLPTTTLLDHQNIRDEYQKVLNGFEDGEYNLDVKELLGEISTARPEDPSSDQSSSGSASHHSCLAV